MTLSYRTTGYGPPLLLLHGMGVTYSIWEKLEPLLCPYYKLISVELPGHGASPFPPEGLSYYAASALMLEELRNTFGIERWSILAYSMGTRVLQEYLRRHPERVSGAYFLCPLRLSRCATALLTLLRWVDPALPGISDIFLRGRILSELVVLLCFQGQRHPYAAWWAKEISSQPVGILRKVLIDLSACGREGFTTDAVPTLFIWGLRDRIVTLPRQLGDLDCSVPGGHAAPVLAAEQIARLIPFYDPARPDVPAAQYQEI